jgi:hypothetical protein
MFHYHCPHIQTAFLKELGMKFPQSKTHACISKINNSPIVLSPRGTVYVFTIFCGALFKRHKVQQPDILVWCMNLTICPTYTTSEFDCREQFILRVFKF